jgi:hypothetical protein
MTQKYIEGLGPPQKATTQLISYFSQHYCLFLLLVSFYITIVYNNENDTVQQGTGSNSISEVVQHIFYLGFHNLLMNCTGKWSAG